VPAGQDQQACPGDQASQLDGVFVFHDILITKHDQRGRVDGPNRVIWYVLEAPHPCGVLVVHGLQLLNVRIHPKECVFERLRHIREARLLYELPQLRLSPGSLGYR
jgi:hypothetical protein